MILADDLGDLGNVYQDKATKLYEVAEALRAMSVADEHKTKYEALMQRARDALLP